MKKNRYGMPPPSTRDEFEHNIYLSIEAAIFKIKNNQSDPGFYYEILPKLQKLTKLPNGRLNLNEVDESLRLDANMRHWMELMPPPEIINNNDIENK